MEWPRRQFLRLTAGAALLPTISRIAKAQSYPTRPVHIIVGVGPGSAADILSRLIGKSLSERLGQPFLIENRGGAGGTLGAEVVVRAPPDGYTLLCCGTPDTINATLNDNLTFNFIRDIVPVAGICRGPLVLVVHPSFPAKTIPEFIAYTKANPAKVSFASAGTGTVAHMAGELFMAMAGVKLVHVPYRDLGQAMPDLLGGQVQAIFSTLPPAIALVKAGKLRAMAVTAAMRSPVLPDLPTIGDFLRGYEATWLIGLGAPSDVPGGIIDRLNNETNATLADPGIKARLDDLGCEPLAMAPADFGKPLADEAEKWAKVIRTANIKPE